VTQDSNDRSQTRRVCNEGITVLPAAHTRTMLVCTSQL